VYEWAVQGAAEGCDDYDPSEWKRYPKAAGATLEALIGPGIFEVRHASSGALFAFEATDNIAHALSSITAGPKSFASWFGKRDSVTTPDLGIARSRLQLVKMPRLLQSVCSAAAESVHEFTWPEPVG
jgi:hypothetical protein